MFSGQTNFLASLGWAVLNSFWQMALLWVIWQVLSAVSAKSRPAIRSILATTLLFTGFAWFLFTFINSLQGFKAVASTGSEILIPSLSPDVNDSLLRLLPTASVVYLLLLTIPLLRFIRNIRYVKLIRQYGLEKIDADWRIFVSTVSNQLGIRKKVQIWISEFVSSPVTVGFLKPVILIPMAAISHLEPAQLEAVILHELAHIRRYDYLVNMLISCIQTILYFNPFVKAFASQVEKEREKSCDELVLQYRYDAHQYATALLLLEKNSHNLSPLLLPAGGHKNDLLQRVEILLGVKPQPVISYRKITNMLAGILFIAFVQFFISSQDHSDRMTTSAALAEATIQPILISNPYQGKNIPVYAVNSPNTIKKSHAGYKPELYEVETPIPSLPIENNLIPVNFNMQEPVQLSKTEEDQVKQAMEASRKVLENVQWKTMEKKIADVFSTREKEALRSSYKKAMNKMDWDLWENKLRQAYDKVDWDQVNDQLAMAVNQVKLDSLQTVYTAVEKKLRKVEEALEINAVSGIPDSDISLKAIEEKKIQAETLLKNIKATRNKKIVHL